MEYISHSMGALVHLSSPSNPIYAPWVRVTIKGTFVLYLYRALHSSISTIISPAQPSPALHCMHTHTTGTAPAMKKQPYLSIYLSFYPSIRLMSLACDP